jgi:hypothetical protein
MPKRLPYLVGAIAVLAMCLIAVPAVAQFGGTTGGIHGKVVDEQGGVLPGVSVTVTGPGAPQTAYTDARGEFHVINLSPGMYTVTLALQGFATINRENVDVVLGRDTELTLPMKLSSVAATVTVSGETPVIDTRKVQTGAAVVNEELKSIPTARDPWVVMQTVPGVQIDRVNVAGSESGQQSNMMTKGTQGATFQVDGVNLTDMSALGSSAAYYDFDSFQEMQVITGGSDPSVQGSAAHLNMITKRGTNELHGNARVFITDHHFQSDNVPEGVALASGNHIQGIQDYGADAGGPLWKDHMWLWGSYGQDQINRSPWAARRPRRRCSTSTRSSTGRSSRPTPPKSGTCAPTSRCSAAARAPRTRSPRPGTRFSRRTRGRSRTRRSSPRASSRRPPTAA